MSEIRGVITALATAFRPGRRVHYRLDRKLAAYLVENSSHGSVVAGSTSESSTPEDDEKIDLTKVEEVGPR